MSKQRMSRPKHSRRNEFYCNQNACCPQLKFHAEQFSVFLNKDYVFGDIVKDEKTYCRNGTVFLNREDCLVMPLHRCPTTLRGFYDRIRGGNAQTDDLLINSFLSKPSNVKTEYVTAYGLNSKSLKASLFNSFQQNDSNTYLIKGRKCLPVVGYLLTGSDIDDIVKTYTGHPYFAMFVKHSLWMLHSIAVQGNLQLEQHEISKEFVRLKHTLIHKNVDASSSCKIEVGSCEFYQTEEEFHVELDLENKSWVDLAGANIQHIMMIQNITSQRVARLKATVKIQTNSFRFLPKIRCKEETHERIDKLNADEILLSQEVSIYNAIYVDPNSNPRTLQQPVDDEQTQLTMKFQTINRGLIPKLKTDSGGRQIVPKFAHSNDVNNFVGILLGYGIPTQIEISNFKINLENDIPAELICASMLRGLEKLIHTTKNNLIEPSVDENEQALQAHIKEHIFPVKLPAMDIRAKTIVDSMLKNFHRHHDNKQNNKAEILQLHPTSRCKQTFGCFVQGPVFNDILFHDRASSVFLYANVPTPFGRSYAPQWDSALEDSEGNALRIVSIGDHINLDEILRSASKTSIFDSELYM